ncbi:MAG: hypothetical protein WDZ41_03685 [Candidatus Babeliales bacterium]
MVVLTIFITLLFSSHVNLCMEEIPKELIRSRVRANSLPDRLPRESINANRKNQEKILENVHKTNNSTNVKERAENFLHEKLAQLQKEKGFSDSQGKFAKRLNPRRKFPIPKILKPIIKPFREPSRFFRYVFTRLYIKPRYKTPGTYIFRMVGLYVVSIGIVPFVALGVYDCMRKYSDSISPDIAPIIGFAIFGSHLAYSFGAIFLEKW